jgi:CubicO group peptidase (beta-lactamase class C family)
VARPTVHGEERLAQSALQVFGDRASKTAIAAVSAYGAEVASIDAPLDADYEIGSISKGITGLLYCDAVNRGEVAASTSLGALLGLGTSPVAGVTLGSITKHASGLPGLPPAAQPLRRAVRLWRTGTNPYGETFAELLEQAQDVRVRSTKPRYSNFGFELLGHALAAGAARTYAELLDDRVARPLQLQGLYAPSTPRELRATALLGRTRRGRQRAPWTGEAIAPAGGIRASIRDMAALVAALLDGSAPGIDAVEPVAKFSGGVRIGAAWMTLNYKGRAITWHNGGTGGFRSWMGLDRNAGTGIVILTASTASADRHGFTLLRDMSQATSRREGPPS